MDREGVMGRRPPPSPRVRPRSRRRPAAFPPCAPPPCVSPALQELHHHGPGEEPASLGPPLPSIQSRHGGPPQWGFPNGQVCLEGSRARGQGEAGHGESEGTRRARGSGGTPR